MSFKFSVAPKHYVYAVQEQRYARLELNREINMDLISWKRLEHFRNCAHFSSQLRLIICYASGSGGTSVINNLLLDSCLINQTLFLDYDSLVLVSPSRTHDIYLILLKGFRAGLTRRHVRKLIEVQDRVIEVDSANKLVGSYKEPNTQISTFNSPAELPPVEELNPNRKKKVLDIMDDSMMHDLTRAEDCFCRARNQNINLVFITQSFTKLKRSTIRINCNSYLLFRKPDTILQNPIYEEIALLDVASFDA